MFCGSFSHVEDDPWCPRSSSARRSRKRKEKNPYRNQGLDKFATVLADLEARREKIMAQVGEQDIYLVRFVESSSRDWEPIVVRLRDREPPKTDAASGKNRPVQKSLGAVDKSPVGFSAMKEVVPGAAASDGRRVKNNGVFMKMEKPSYYWPVILIMILLCLVMFGRPFAILCMSIWWYLVPTIKGGNEKMRRRMKNYGRRLSVKNLGCDVRSLQSNMGHEKFITKTL